MVFTSVLIEWVNMLVHTVSPSEECVDRGPNCTMPSAIDAPCYLDVVGEPAWPQKRSFRTDYILLYNIIKSS